MMDDQMLSEEMLQAVSHLLPNGYTEDDVLDLLQNPLLMRQFLDEEQYLSNYYAELQKNYSVYHECVLPVTNQAYDTMCQLVVFCLVLRILSLTKLPSHVLHAFSIAFGCASLWKFYGVSCVYILLPATGVLVLRRTGKARTGTVLLFASMGYLISCEFLFLDAVEWNKIKGSSMIVLMKLVSVAFDIEAGLVQPDVPLVGIFGYLLNPASIILGPYIPFKDYMQILSGHPLSIRWMFNTGVALIMSLSFLLWSSCGTSHYMAMLDAYAPFAKSIHWNAYKEAMAFRFSHYYVSYFSEATCLLSGVCSIEHSDSANLGSSYFSDFLCYISNIRLFKKRIISSGGNSLDSGTNSGVRQPLLSSKSDSFAASTNGTHVSRAGTPYERPESDMQRKLTGTDKGESPTCAPCFVASTASPDVAETCQLSVPPNRDLLKSSENLIGSCTGSRPATGTDLPRICNSEPQCSKPGATLTWRKPVARAAMVELPRSLVDVVTNWNLPMHYWLKQYIFKRTRKFGVFAAILLTYFASSVLHGLNAQLSAVLLTIGTFAYVEHVFRNLLADSFSACVEARKCRPNCKHRYKQTNLLVVLANLVFGLIAVWNLAYLGCPFDNSGEEEQGYSLSHTVKTWQKYQYVNHWFMLCGLLTYRLIDTGYLFRTSRKFPFVKF